MNTSDDHSNITQDTSHNLNHNTRDDQNTQNHNLSQNIIFVQTDDMQVKRNKSA